MIKIMALLVLFSCSTSADKKPNTQENPSVINVQSLHDSSLTNIVEKSEFKLDENANVEPVEIQKEQPLPKAERGKNMPVGEVIVEIVEPATNSDSATSQEVKSASKSDDESNQKPDLKEEKPLKADLHKHWDYLLKNYVANGKVNYRGLKSEHTKLKSYVEMLGNTNPNQKSWSRAQKLAYWINAYNAVTVDLILDNYPLKSITALDGGNTWKVKRFRRGAVVYSLDQIENEIIRPKFKDARIHFAVNCAAKSCPPLLNEAFKASKLDAQLDRQTRKFINNSNYNLITATALKASKIFEWYAEDFGNLHSFFRKYANQPVDANLKVVFLEYDWALNE